MADLPVVPPNDKYLKVYQSKLGNLGTPSAGITRSQAQDTVQQLGGTFGGTNPLVDLFNRTDVSPDQVDAEMQRMGIQDMVQPVDVGGRRG